jgi:hypothetical protein
MQLAQRLDLLVRLQAYILGNDAEWLAAKEKAFIQNGWFIPEFIDLSVRNIATYLLSRRTLQKWAGKHQIPDLPSTEKTIGLVLPGNIPLAGFYDFLCVFLSGHRLRIKLSPKDDVLLKHLIQKLAEWEPVLDERITMEDMLKGCNAYITTSEKTSGPFTKYFGRYPGIIHRHGTAAAVLDGLETRQQLEFLADDVFQYFGRGCMNVTRLYVPKEYDFIPLLKVFDKYGYLIDHNKYKNNYDYQLAMLILNKEFYMTNGCILLTENKSGPAPTARLNYEFYTTEQDLEAVLKEADNPPSLVGTRYLPFGRAQQSVICEQNGQPTLQFLLDL